MVAIDWSVLSPKTGEAPATKGGSESNMFCIPSVSVVLFSQERHPHGLYSAVESGRMFLAFPSSVFTLLVPSLANPETAAEADGGKLNV